MTIVNISDTLIYTIEENIDKMAAKELDALKLDSTNNSKLDAAHNQLYRAIENYFWEGETELRKLLPNKWKAVHQVVHIENDKIGAYFKTQEGARTQLQDSFELPPNTSNWGLKIPNSAFSKACIAALDDAYKMQREIETKFEAIKTQITGYLSTQKTLNKACAAYPAIRLYLPPKALERMEADKVTKRATSPVALNNEILAVVGATNKLAL